MRIKITYQSRVVKQRVILLTTQNVAIVKVVAMVKAMTIMAVITAVQR